MSTVASVIGITRPHLSAMRNKPLLSRRGRPPLPDTELATEIRALIAELPTYGYCRVHALLRRHAEKTGRAAPPPAFQRCCASLEPWQAPPNSKRLYRVMKVNGLLLQRHSGRVEERRHDGRVMVDQRNTRWCSYALEFGCDNGEKVRVVFALDCCDREAMGHVATTGGITAEDVQDLMVATVEHRYGPSNRLPEPIEWLSDNGSPYTNIMGVSSPPMRPYRAVSERSLPCDEFVTSVMIIRFCRLAGVWRAYRRSTYRRPTTERHVRSRLSGICHENNP